MVLNVTSTLTQPMSGTPIPGQALTLQRKLAANLEAPEGFEPSTVGLENHCSDPLNYGAKDDTILQLALLGQS